MSIEQQFKLVKPGDVGIIGNPVSHSLSPRMHTPALRIWWTTIGHVAESAPVYHRFLVEVDELEKALELVRDRDLTGVNVTIPYKRAVCARLDWIDPFAAEVSSVNTIKRQDQKLLGFNTDADGFEMAILKDLNFSPKDKTALVFGLGGTGVVIIKKLLSMGLAQIYYWNRSANKTLGDGKSDPRLVMLSEKEASAKSAEVDLIVNATSVGLKENDPLPVPNLRFRAGQFVYDVIYHRETMMVTQAKAAGATASGGLGMLLYQGAKAFEVWTGWKAPLEIMRKGLTST